MKNHVLIIAGAALAMTSISQAATNLLNNPGFEGLPTGPIPDVLDNNVWASFSNGQNNMSVSTTYAHSGTQSLRSGPNMANQGPNARQSERDLFLGPGDIEGKSFDISFWVFYAGGDAPTGSLTWQFLATNNFNVHLLTQGGTISVSDLTADSWTEFSYRFTVPLADPAPTDPNLITNQVKMSFSRNGYVDGATTGNFYVDDANVSLVPEPSILGLLALAPALALRRRRA